MRYPMFFIIVCLSHFFIACAPDARERDLTGTRMINPPATITKSLYGDITDIQYIPLRPDVKAYPAGIRQLLYHNQYFIMLCYQRGLFIFMIIAAFFNLWYRQLDQARWSLLLHKI